jgi:cyclopropane fatty-acyl-phospholipid synthase-like methyltransferase
MCSELSPAVTAGRVPDRIRWAVELLAVESDDRLLEIGCGSGAAVDLLAARLARGHITAIDRSAAQLRLARTRNRRHVAAGKARFIRTAARSSTCASGISSRHGR